MVKILRYKNCECNFVYVEEFDSAELAATPENKGKVVEVKIGTIKHVFTTIKQKEQLVGTTKTSSAKVERSAGEKVSQSS